ncbi:MAG: hypothetical protein A3E01_02840 [Gammaproteobacteria bacterium RIFCSPHIGHO2_12_FULL_63_22]|nr:MAG: hypothetical protein A3E01_02840 [Gammaproteobacteria bacterium RIFCSPHIGHO2_12_FULL_63_22]
MTIEYASAWSADNATSIAASSIANTATDTTGEISGDAASIEFGFQIVYGGTATQGVKAYLLHHSGTAYQDVSDNPPAIELPYSVSGTHDFSWTVTGLAAGKYKVHLTNNSGATVTATVNYRTSTVNSTDTSAATAGDMLATLINADVSITGATTLTSSAFGKRHVCTGSSDYTITLPAVSSNDQKAIEFIFNQNAGVLITIDGNGSETIGTNLTRSYIPDESAVMQVGGGIWNSFESLVYPEFFAHRNSVNQTGISDVTWTKVEYNDDSTDPGTDPFAIFDAATNYRFTANRPGSWQIRHQVNIAGTTLTEGWAGLWLNTSSGGPTRQSPLIVVGSANGYGAVDATMSLVKSDYLHAITYGNVASGTVTVVGGAVVSYFTARWLGHG